MKVGHIRAQRKARDLRIVPVDRKGDGSVTQNTEVKSVVGIFPDVIPAEYEVLAKSLLEAGMEFVAETRFQGSRYPRRTDEKRSKHSIRTSGARQHEILVERRLQSASIGNAQHRAGTLEAVSDAHTRFRLARYREAVIQITADTEIEEPVPGLDLVLDIHGQFLDIGAAEIMVKMPPRVRS